MSRADIEAGGALAGEQAHGGDKVLVDRRTLALAFWVLSRSCDEHGAQPLFTWELEEARDLLEDALAAPLPGGCNVGARFAVRHSVAAEHQRAMRSFLDAKQKAKFEVLVAGAACDLEQHRAVCGRCGGGPAANDGSESR